MKKAKGKRKVKQEAFRQRLRKGLVFGSFLLFPVTLFYFSPALSLEGAAKGIVSGSLLLFGLLFLSSLFLGRAFCGWVCPGSGFGEAAVIFQNRPATGGRADWIKYIIWVPWISTMGFLAYRAGGFHKVDPFFQTTKGISIAQPWQYTIYFGIILLFLIPAIFAGRRGFCHYICWMAPFMVIGTKIRNLFGWPSLHLKAMPESCHSCGKCSSRCPMSLDVVGMVERDNMQDSECILCGGCVDNCPSHAIDFGFWSKK